MSRRCKHVPDVYRVFPDPDRTWPVGCDMHRLTVNLEPQTIPDWMAWCVEGTCEYGNCLEWRCPICGCHNGGGIGPMLCPCEDWIGYHDMRRTPHPSPRKASLGVYGRRRRRTRKV